MALAICTLATTACNEATQAPQATPPPPVTVATPIRKEIVEWDEYTGRTEAVESVEVRPRVSGYIEQISFKDGQLVKPGDLLFVIDPRPYQDVLDQAKANLQSAEAQRQLQAANLARAEWLFQTHVSSRQDYDTNVSQKNQAEAQVGQARAQVNAAQLNLDFTQVKAPIAGRISRQLVTRGNLVQADSTVLTTLVSVDPIYAYFNVDERTVQKYVNQIKRGLRMGPSAARPGGPAGGGAHLPGPPISAAQSAEQRGFRGRAGRRDGRAAHLARSPCVGHLSRNVVPKRFGAFVTFSCSGAYKFMVFKMGLTAFALVIPIVGPVLTS